MKLIFPFRIPTYFLYFSYFCNFPFQVNVLVGFQVTPKTDELLLSNSFMKLVIEF